MVDDGRTAGPVDDVTKAVEADEEEEETEEEDDAVRSVNGTEGMFDDGTEELRLSRPVCTPSSCRVVSVIASSSNSTARIFRSGMMLPILSSLFLLVS